jgi:hypothetical protein
MAQISIDIPDAKAQQALNAACAAINYQAQLPDGTPNPQTKAQAVKQHLAEYLKALVRKGAGDAAAIAARDAAQADVEGITIN